LSFLSLFEPSGSLILTGIFISFISTLLFRITPTGFVSGGKYRTKQGAIVIYLFSVALLGNLDAGPTIGGYLGLLFMGAAYLALGLFASSLTENQIVAFIVAFAIIFLLFILDKILD